MSSWHTRSWRKTVDSNPLQRNSGVHTRTIFHRGKQWPTGTRRQSTGRFSKGRLTTSCSTQLHFSWLVSSRCPTSPRCALRTFSLAASFQVTTCGLKPFLSLNLKLLSKSKRRRRSSNSNTLRAAARLHSMLTRHQKTLLSILKALNFHQPNHFP